MPEDERPHPAADLSIPQWLQLLSAGEMEIEGRLPWSSNYSFLVTLSLGGTTARAVYKPGRGERQLWDFGDRIFRREVAAYELSAGILLGLVPETVLRADAPLGEGSLQRFIEADFSEHYFSLLAEEVHHGRLRELAGLDLLLNNADRKAGHVLIDSGGGIWGIDNGLSFHVEPKLRTVMWDFATEPLPETVVAACRRVVSAVPGPVARLISAPECLALQERATRLLARPRFPEPREEHRSYPWPLV